MTSSHETPIFLVLEENGLGSPSQQVFWYFPVSSCSLCCQSLAGSQVLLRASGVLWFVPSPAPQGLCALKIRSKAASNPPVFIINTTPFIRVHSSFCFPFLPLPFHCFPGASMGMAPRPRPGSRNSFHQSFLLQSRVCCGVFFPPRFNSICI